MFQAADGTLLDAVSKHKTQPVRRHEQHQARTPYLRVAPDITAYGEEGISDDCDGEQDEEEDDEIHETMVAHARLDASDILVETPPKAPPGTRRPRKPPRVIPSPPPPTPQCAGGYKEYSRRGTNATVERFTCVDCGFVTTRSKGGDGRPSHVSSC